MNAAPEAIVFDLFGTLVFFDDSRFPRVQIEGRSVPTTLPELPRMLERCAPGLAPDRFLASLREVGAELLEHKRRLGIEIATEVRFQQALERCGIDSGAAVRAGGELALAHMEALASAVVVPPDRNGLLARLSGSYRLALVSNFDHGPTARAILARCGLDVHLEAIVISAEEGVRKPVASIFHRACEQLALAPSRCLYIGDTFAEDVEGSAAAGLASVWVTSQSEVPPPALGALADVSDLPAWLQARFAGAPDPGG